MYDPLLFICFGLFCIEKNSRLFTWCSNVVVQNVRAVNEESGKKVSFFQQWLHLCVVLFNISLFIVFMYINDLECVWCACICFGLFLSCFYRSAHWVNITHQRRVIICDDIFAPVSQHHQRGHPCRMKRTYTVQLVKPTTARYGIETIPFSIYKTHMGCIVLCA